MTDAIETPDDAVNNDGTEAIDALALLAKKAEAGEISHIELIDAFLATTIYVPSVTDPEEGPIDPVMSKIDEVEYLVIASTVAVLDQTADVARYAVPMDGKVIVEGMNPEVGLLVNLTGGAFAMPKAMLDDLRAGNPLG